MGSHLAIHAASNHRWRVPPSWGGAATGSGPGEGMRPEGRAAATRTGAAAARGGKGTRPEGECNHKGKGARPRPPPASPSPSPTASIRRASDDEDDEDSLPAPLQSVAAVAPPLAAVAPPLAAAPSDGGGATIQCEFWLAAQALGHVAMRRSFGDDHVAGLHEHLNMVHADVLKVLNLLTAQAHPSVRTAMVVVDGSTPLQPAGLCSVEGTALMPLQPPDLCGGAGEPVPRLARRSSSAALGDEADAAGLCACSGNCGQLACSQNKNAARYSRTDGQPAGFCRTPAAGEHGRCVACTCELAACSRPRNSNKGCCGNKTVPHFLGACCRFWYSSVVVIASPCCCCQCCYCCGCCCYYLVSCQVVPPLCCLCERAAPPETEPVLEPIRGEEV